MTVAKDLLAEVRERPSDLVEHVGTLFDTVSRYREPAVVELGVAHARSTVTFLAALEDVGGHLWSVDLCEPVRSSIPGDGYGPRLEGHPQWTFLIGDSRDPGLYGKVPEPDVLFIDTSHTFVNTCVELSLWAPRLRPGGTILMHDTRHDADGDGDLQVLRGAMYFLSWHPGWDWHEAPNCYGLGTIRRP